MHHAALATPSPNLHGHIDKAFDLAPQVSALALLGIRVSSVLAPLAAEHTALGGIGRDGNALDQGQALRLVEPGAFALAGGKDLVQEGGVDDADDGNARDDEGDGDAEHGEEVGVINGTVKRVDAPGGVVWGDEVVFGSTSRVGLFAYESV